MLDFYLAFSNWQNFQRVSMEIEAYIQTHKNNAEDVEQHISSFLDHTTGKRYFIFKNESTDEAK